MPNYRRANVKGGVFFFTVVLADRSSDLLTEEIVQLRAAYRAVRARRPFETVAICVLPDHLHALWALPENDRDFALRWGLIKSGFSRGIDARPRSQSKISKREKGIWQRRYWEHTIRDDADLERHIDYIHYNPVEARTRRTRRGLAPQQLSSVCRTRFARGGLGWRYARYRRLLRRMNAGHASLCPPYGLEDDQAHLRVPAACCARGLRSSPRKIEGAGNAE